MNDKNMLFRCLTLILFLLGVFCLSFGQTIQSNGTGGGAWNSPTTWTGGVIPTAFNSWEISIRAGDVVTVPSGYTVQVDQMYIRGGVVNVLAGGVIDILNGAGNDLTISNNGRLNVAGRIELSTFGNIAGSTTVTTTFQAGSVYRHKYTSDGAIIIATWQDGSTVELVGFTSSSGTPGNLGQSFYNFVWNNPNQTTARNIPGLTTVRGDLIFESTGSTYVGIFDSYSNQTLTVLGNVVVNGTASVYFSRTGVNNVINVGEDFIYNSTGYSQFTQTGTISLNVSGDFTHNSSGELRIGSYSTSRTNINLSGDLLLNGPLTSAFSAVANFAFQGSEVQSYSRTSFLSGIFNFEVKSGSTLDLGTSFISGSGTFALRTGGTLRLGAISGNGTDGNGALQSNTSQGNIRVSVANRTYESGSTIVYNSNSAQQIGNGHPNSSSIDLLIDNATSVTLLTNLTNRQVTLNQGSLVTNAFNVNVYGDWVVNSGVLIPGTGTVFFNTTSQIAGPGVKNFGNLTINSPGAVSLPNDNIFISGNLIVAVGAALNTNSSTIVFEGGTSQNVSSNGTEFNNITVNKSAGDVSLLSALNLQGRLLIESNTAVYSNGNLMLLSRGDSPAIDGSIGPLATGASVTGNVTVQRYFREADNYNRFIASPVGNATIAQLQEAFPVTGGFAGTSFPCEGCNNDGASLKWYRESATGVFKNGYTSFPGKNGSNTETLTPSVGYDAYMWNGVTPATINFRGTINSGSINFLSQLGSSLSYTQSNPASSADGWNLVGNPYPSAIQWNNGAGWSRTNIDPTVWVWDVVGRVWHTYNANTSVGDLTDGVIATGQGFWIKVASPGTGSIVINEQAKSGAGSGSYYRQKSFPVAIISLAHQGFTDNAFIIMDERATDDFDLGLDAEKLELGIERLSVSVLDRAERKLGHYAINGISAERIPLHVFADMEGEYELGFSSVDEIDGLGAYYLFDAYTGKSMAVSSGSSYKFSIAEDNLSNPGRFFLTKTPPSDFSEEQQVVLSSYPNPVSGMLNIEVNSEAVKSISLIDNVGKVVSAIPFVSDKGVSKATIDVSHYSQGFYFVKVVTENKLLLKKVIKF